MPSLDRRLYHIFHHLPPSSTYQVVKNCNQTEIKSCKWRLYQIISNTIVAKYLSLFDHLQLTWHFASDQSACMERHIFYIPMLQPPLLFTDLRALLLVLSVNHSNCLVFDVAAFFYCSPLFCPRNAWPHAFMMSLKH